AGVGAGAGGAVAGGAQDVAGVGVIAPLAGAAAPGRAPRAAHATRAQVAGLVALPPGAGVEIAEHAAGSAPDRVAAVVAWAAEHSGWTAGGRIPGDNATVPIGAAGAAGSASPAGAAPAAHPAAPAPRATRPAPPGAAAA